MAKTKRPVTLDLTTLPESVELSRPVAEALALAASVCLATRHKRHTRYKAVVHREAQALGAEIVPTHVDLMAEETYNDPQEATEEGAEAVALAAARAVLDRIAFRRLPKGTGADYLLRRADSRDGDDYDRLECSGIGEGDESVDARLREKVRQLARFPASPPGWAAVTDFRALPVALHLGRWEAP